MSSRRAHRSTRHTAPVLVAAAVFTAAGGFVHAREWLDTYRDVPAAAPGAFLVRVGFPFNAGVSLVLALALLGCAARATRLAPLVIAGTAAFQAGSLVTLILTRTGSVFGWSEPIWTRGANESRAVELGALVALAAATALVRLQRRQTVARVEPSSDRRMPGPVPATT